jgi:hypothetical protein
MCVCVWSVAGPQLPDPKYSAILFLSEVEGRGEHL